ncbi:unnamed protein product [Spirodela intermedia]|uniref:Uncharacterized protein n=1 Tax=Spirodela intermedia TaxID=51605 RepID=A0A7I8J1V9_SPIIN|nr:unnamed protein product [Spirodela intermedia]CAA6663300.1 unnamed protein product [Spirodela intermedia]
MADASADDLDNLLDSALDDFSNLNLDPGRRWSGLGDGPVTGSAAEEEGRQLPRARGAPPKDVSHASEALAMLTQQTQHAFMGLESTLGAQGPPGIEDLEKEGIMEDFVKQFEEIAGTQDMDSLVETMMQQLLSKEILHEPMKEIAGRYPKWLEEHSKELCPVDYDRYHNQYQFILKLNEVYENEPENFTKIIELMQKMQECGQPPVISSKSLPPISISPPSVKCKHFSPRSSPDSFGAPSNCGIM